MNKITVVEDETEIRESLVQILELSGYEVRSAPNGQAGFDLILEQKPDLVLCDVNMPQMDGFELLGAISQYLNGAMMPVFLFLTARVESSDIRHGLKLGADDYVLKPFNHVELLEIVKLRLRKRQQILESTERVEPALSLGMFKKLAIPCQD